MPLPPASSRVLVAFLAAGAAAGVVLLLALPALPALQAATSAAASTWTRGPAGPMPTNDPAMRGGLEWNLEAIGAPAAWTRSTGRGITVAVVDTGVDRDHPDLAGHVVGGTDCISSGGDVRRCHGTGDDTNGHGTHVAGIIAATRNNGRGVAGVAPSAHLLAVRVMSGCSHCRATGSVLDVATGVRWAVDHGAEVINLSLAGTDIEAAHGPLAGAVRAAWSEGVVVVAAAPSSTLTAPFGDDPVVVVTALGPDGTVTPYDRSLRPARWAVAAPGGLPGDTGQTCAPGGTIRGIVSTAWVPGSDPEPYGCLAGTSMAAPHVAGAIAVLRSLGLSPEAAVRRVLHTARDLGAAGTDELYGAGALDLGAAVGLPPVTGASSGQARRSGAGDARVLGATITRRARTEDAAHQGLATPASFVEPQGAAHPRRWLPWSLGVALVGLLVWVVVLVTARRRADQPRRVSASS